MTRLFRILVYSNVWVALAGSCLLASTYILLGLSFNFYLIALVFFGILSMYNFQRLYKREIYIIGSLSPRHQWIAAYSAELRSVTIVSTLCAAILALIIPIKVTLGLLPAVLLTLAYSIPIIPVKGKRIRLRELPGAKIFLVAAVWTWVTVFMPFCAGEISADTSQLYLIATERFFFCLLITLPFDYRDLAVDSASGLRTLPVLLGRVRMKRLYTLVAASGIACSLFFPGYNLLLCLHYFFILYWVLKARPECDELYFSGLLDGMVHIRFLLLFLVNLLMS
jgi:4-hydroxybenzoate polyprenyltransferase